MKRAGKGSRYRLPESVMCGLSSILRVAVLLPIPFLILDTSASAYVGPGAGLSMLGSAIALIVVFLVAVAGLVIWPIRAMQRRKKKPSEDSEEE